MNINWRFVISASAWNLMLAVPVVVFALLDYVVLALLWFLLAVFVFLMSADSWVRWIYFSEEE